MNNKEETSYHKTWVEIKKYFTLQLDYAKLTAVEKLTLLLSAMTLLVVALILGAGILFYLSFALLHSLELMIGSTVCAYLLVSGFFALILLGVIIFKQQLIMNPIAKFLSKLFLDPTK